MSSPAISQRVRHTGQLGESRSFILYLYKVGGCEPGGHERDEHPARDIPVVFMNQPCECVLDRVGHGRECANDRHCGAEIIHRCVAGPLTVPLATVRVLDRTRLEPPCHSHPLRARIECPQEAEALSITATTAWPEDSPSASAICLTDRPG